MTAVATRSASATPRPAALDVFRERAWARAYLWRAGEFDLGEAVDVLQAEAVRTGLVDRVGQDAVQQILADAFAPHREVVS
jgi:hypothetical protein